MGPLELVEILRISSQMPIEYRLAVSRDGSSWEGWHLATPGGALGPYLGVERVWEVAGEKDGAAWIHAVRGAGWHILAPCRDFGPYREVLAWPTTPGGEGGETTTGLVPLSGGWELVLSRAVLPLS